MSLIELIEALVFIVVLSMSGVLIPGPMTLAVISHAVAKGAMAGVLVVLGHALIEIPLIILIYMGLISTIGIEQVNPIVAIIGGVSFLLMSISALKYVLKGSFELKALKVSSTSTFMAGIITTAFNPSFILWWPTTGLLMVNYIAVLLGPLALLVLILVHEACDLFWYTFIGFLTKKGASTSTKLLKSLIIACNIFLAVYGIYFILMGVRSLVGV